MQIKFHFSWQQNVIFVVINRVWHFGFETFAKFFEGLRFGFLKIGHEKKVSVLEYLISKTNEAKWQEKDKNKSKYKGIIICCWLWYWSLNWRASIISKHLKGQLDPPVSDVTFLHQRRSVGSPSPWSNIFCTKGCQLRPRVPPSC